MTSRATIDFGIDLGTTNSTIAVIDGTDARVIPNKAGSTVTPSAVWINPRGNLLVGQEAKERTLTTDVDNGDIEFKLRMGLGPEGAKQFTRSGRKMLPEELSAEVLKSLKTDAYSNMGEEVSAAVITVPAAFELPMSTATQKAAELAGFVRAPLLLEPVAASLAYGFQSTSENAYWFVYDFGGGTFDAALMRVRDGQIQVVNHNGDNHLGGKLIDWDLVSLKVAPALIGQYNLPDFRRGSERWRNAIGRLKFEVEKAKIEVCRKRAAVEIYIESLGEDADGKPVEVVYALTPKDVEEVSRPYIERSLRLCRQTLEDKGIAGTSLERVLMVGGSTLNPWVREAVEAELGARLEFGIDPVTVVARGAAIFASTQSAPTGLVAVPLGTWRIEIEHEPVGNESDPDIGGRVVPEGGAAVEGCTIELRDKKTKWSSGLIRLGSHGTFMTQLYADQHRRCEFEIELLDPSGRRIPTEPAGVVYTIGVVPTMPPSPNTIGIGLADGSVDPLIPKGKPLPAEGDSRRKTTVPLRAGNAEDVVRIPILEGENPRAERNHLIGTLFIYGSEVHRDLSPGSDIDITLHQDAGLKVTVRAFVPVLDEEFEAEFRQEVVRRSPQDLHEELNRQKARLETVRREAGGDNPQAAQALDRIAREGMVAEADSLAKAANEDQDALTQLDRRLLDLAAAIDRAADATVWPKALAEAKESQKMLHDLITRLDEATPADRERVKILDRELERAIESRDEGQVRRCLTAMERLRFDLLQRLPVFWVAQLEYAEAHVGTMTDPAQAQRLIAEGRRAVNTNDVPGLIAAVRQLFSLFPADEREEARNRLGSGII